MNKTQEKDLRDILTQNSWEARKLALGWLDKQEVTKDVGLDQRTGAQNNSLHLWFQQISDTCANQGVTFNMIMKHPADIAVTPDNVKGLWKVLQKALFGTDSTTKLKKVGEIERMVDHFIVLFAKEEVELPPFPSNDSLENEKMVRDNYPEEYEKPKI